MACRSAEKRYEPLPTTENEGMRRYKPNWPKSVAVGIGWAILAVLTSFGLLHITIVLLGHVNFFGRLPPNLQLLSVAFSHRTSATTNSQHVTAIVPPIPCHSHNDYLRGQPLFDALRVGCMSIEADIWLSDHNETEILVGHKKSSLKQSKTLRSLYLDPILDILDSQNSSTPWMFETFPDQTLTLLLDFKENGTQLLPHVNKHLEPFRQKTYLSLRNGKAGPITVVASGKAPTDLPEDMFLDADLSDVASVNASISYYASTSFAKTIGKPVLGRLSSQQRARVREQIKDAHGRGLKARYWDTPSWPVSLRNYVWETLLAEGADLLNVDDLYATAFLDWSWVRWELFDG